MRIISGKYRGRRLRAPKNLPVRPTTDRAKESLFNILNNTFDFHTIKVLDLFCGTGNISYEFASRGTENIIAVDKNIHCIKYLKKTIRELQWDEVITPVKRDAFKFIKNKLPAQDIIFADPPYTFRPEALECIINGVTQSHLLARGGWLVIEHSSLTQILPHPHFIEIKKYGQVCFSFFRQNKK